jgi:hypothetical protein
MGEWENNALQLQIIFKIFCIYNYTSLLHRICPKGLYRYKRWHEIYLLKFLIVKVKKIPTYTSPSDESLFTHKVPIFKFTPFFTPIMSSRKCY